jgi:hypothetical protein
VGFLPSLRVNVPVRVVVVVATPFNTPVVGQLLMVLQLLNYGQGPFPQDTLGSLPPMLTVWTGPHGPNLLPLLTSCATCIRLHHLVGVRGSELGSSARP